MPTARRPGRRARQDDPRRTTGLFAPRAALRIQYPMLASMVVLTCGAVALVLAP